MMFWRWFFAFAAVWNIAAGLPGLIDPANDALGFGYGRTPGDLLMVRMVGLLVAIFGVGYALVASNPKAHRGIVILGALGKIATAVLIAQAFLAQSISGAAFAMGLSDLAFAAAFIVFLWTSRP